MRMPIRNPIVDACTNPMVIKCDEIRLVCKSIATMLSAVGYKSKNMMGILLTWYRLQLWVICISKFHIRRGCGSPILAHSKR